MYIDCRVTHSASRWRTRELGSELERRLFTIHLVAFNLPFVYISIFNTIETRL